MSRTWDDILQWEYKKERIQEALNSGEIDYSEARYLKQQVSIDRMMNQYSHLTLNEQISCYEDDFEYFSRDLRIYMPMGAMTSMAMMLRLMGERIKIRHCE